MKKLYRSRKDSMIAGVCGGLGNYFQIDPTIVRMVFALLAFYHFLGVWAYIVLAVLLPKVPEGYSEDSQEFSSAENTQTVKVVGGGLAVLGILALVSMMDLSWFHWMRLDNFWPVVIILFGVLLLVRGVVAEE
ncbi:MAG TPA: PspC domain-containing protein [Anaerolineales bacterium]|nr:PspC domain-containing protein [Anaerolineales bacterium]